MSGARRWRGTDVPPVTVAPKIVIQRSQRRTIRVPKVRDGNITSPPFGQAAANTNQPVLVRPPSLRRSLRVPPIRRADLMSPPWPQATAPANPAITELTGRRPRLQRQGPREKRAHLWIPPWPQAAANTNQPYLAFVWQARRRFAWLRRRALALTPLSQADVLPPIAQPDQRREERFGPIRRGEFALPPWAQVTAPANPAFTDWQRRRPLARTWAIIVRARKGAMVIQQATTPVNPVFVVPAALRRRALSILARRGRPAESPRSGADLIAVASQPRRIRWALLRRMRTTAFVAAQDAPLNQGPRRRLIAVQRRRPLLGFIPAQVVIPNPAIVEFIRAPKRIRQWMRQRSGRFFTPGWGQSITLGLPVGEPTKVAGFIGRTLSAIGGRSKVGGSAGRDQTTISGRDKTSGFSGRDNASPN